ncbi:MAG: hypothetical protein ACYTDX_03230 [Planctomycetota bacterium]
MTVFLLAGLVHDRLVEPSRPAQEPSGFEAPADLRGAVRILTGEVSLGVEVALIPLRADGLSDEGMADILDEALFPDGPRHRWYRLLVTNAPGEGAFRLGLGEGSLRLVGENARTGNVDLSAVYAARRADLSPHRRMDLRLVGVDAGGVEVIDGGSSRVLLAFPEGVSVDTAAYGELGGARRLWPVEVTTESLRAALLDGRIGSLEAVLRAEVTAPGRVPAGEDPR